MIQLLFTVIFVEMGLIVALLFKTPLRRFVIIGLDRVKRGRGPVMVKTVGGTVFVVLLSTLQGMAVIQENLSEGGLVNPTDQVLMARHMLEASLMGFLLFLALMLDRLHHYIRELRLLRKTIETGKKQTSSFKDTRHVSSNDKNVPAEDVSALKRKMKHQLESECDSYKAEELRAAEANAEALNAQSEGFLEDHNQLIMENNQKLWNQLHLYDQISSLHHYE
uniref:Endoplasmic reticulum transmembrane protein n=1 Tax=Kalanchoe fedtschenkoi TaxID=63787 RepID=A0A7N1A542_KALFE